MGGDRTQSEMSATADRRQQYLTSVLAGDGAGATMTIAEAMLADVTLEDVVTGILRPALAEVGRLWQNGELSVAEEHMASEITMAALHRFTPQHGAAAPGARTAVVSCVPGEDHRLGAQAVTAVLRRRGWHVVLLGASTPAGALATFVALRRPALVALSVKSASRVPDAIEAIRLLRRTDPDLKILVGGDAVAGVGADVGAHHLAVDLSSALQWLDGTFSA